MDDPGLGVEPDDYSNLESQIDSGCIAEAVFADTKEVGVQVVKLQPPGKTMDQPVVKTAANGCGERIVGISPHAYVGSAEQEVGKWRES